MNKRLGILDIWRLIACMMIMSYHLPTLDSRYTDPNTPFRTAWIFVEFFFVITGCLTFSHYDGAKIIGVDNVGKESIRYTLKKFLGFAPFIVIGFILKIAICVVINGREQDLFVKVLPEILLISRGDGFMPVLWYLSALFIVFPLFCCICQIKQRHIVYVFSMLAVVIVYDTYLVNLGVRTPTHLIRALAGLLLGILVSYCSKLIAQIHFSRIEKIVLTLLEEFVLVYSAYLTYKNSTYYNVIIILFFVGLSIMMSGSSYTSVLNSKITGIVGVISLPMYINQDFVAIIINRYLPTDELGLKTVSFYIINIVVSTIMYFVIVILKKRIHFNRLEQIQF